MKIFYFSIILFGTLLAFTSCNKKNEERERSSRAPMLEDEYEKNDIGFESFGKEKVFYEFSYEDESKDKNKNKDKSDI